MKNLARETLHKLGIHNLRENMEYDWLKLQGKPYYWTNYPMAVQIDTTNKCGPKADCSGIFCSYCFPQGEVLAGRDFHTEMPMDWIKWIFKDIAKHMPHLTNKEWPPRQQTCLFLNGDWQNETRSQEILELYNNFLSWLPSQVFTCGTKPEQSWRFTNPKLNWVCVTCSAPDRETYKKVHGGDKFESVMETMRYIDTNAHSSQHLEVHCVVTKDNIESIGNWYKLMGEKFPRWRRVLSPLVKSQCNQRSVDSMGNLTVEEQEQRIKLIDSKAQFWNHQTTALRQPCVLWNNAAITVHGEVLQCCNWDAKDKWNYGYIQDYIDEGRSLKDYWLERLANKQRNSLCRACNLRHPQFKQRLNNIKLNVEVNV